MVHLSSSDVPPLKADALEMLSTAQVRDGLKKLADGQLGRSPVLEFAALFCLSWLSRC